MVPFVRAEPESGVNVLHLLVEGVHCGACVRKIERTLGRESDLLTARVNLTTRRLTLRWQGEARRGNRLTQAVAGLGYGVVPFTRTGCGLSTIAPSASCCVALPWQASPRAM